MKKTFTTRLLAIVLCVAMLATVTPIFASAETVITEVTITNADITPVLGEKMIDHTGYTLPEGAPYYKYYSGKNDWSSSPSESGDTFVEGVTYSRFISLEATDGYLFDENTVITVNGTLFEGAFNVCRWLYDGGKYLIIMMPGVKLSAETIDTLDITNNFTPIVGDTISQHKNFTLPEDCHCTLSLVEWYHETGVNAYEKMKNDATFEAGQRYYVFFYIQPDVGYTLSDTFSVTLNGSTELIDTAYSELTGGRYNVYTNTTEAVEKSVINKIEIDGFCDAVVGGKAGDFIHLTLPEDAPYYFDYSLWYNDTDDHGLSSEDTFEAGKFYTLGGGLYADEGYIFAEDAEVLLNGGDVGVDVKFTKIDSNDAGIFRVWSEPREAVEKSADIEITEITITDADITPYIGASAADCLHYTLPEDCHFTVARHYWYDETVGHSMTSEDVFAAGLEYDLCWTFKAGDGYVFAEDATVTINGQTDIVDPKFTEIDGEDNTFFYVCAKPTEAAEKPDPIETTVDLRIGDKEFIGVKGGETLVVESLDAMQDITVLVQNGVDIEGMSEDWSMSTKFLDSEGRGVLEVQVFEEGDDYVTFNLQSHYADCPGANVQDFQIMMITVKVEASAEKLLGDANDDGNVNMKDVLLMRKFLAGMSVTLNEQNSDVTGDGNVNMKDVLQLRKYLAGIIKELG